MAKVDAFIKQGVTMKYQDGSEIRAGDEILLDGGMTGVVLCCFDSSEYTPEFDYDNWLDLFKTGLMVDSDQIGLIYYSEPDLEFELVSRKKQFINYIRNSANYRIYKDSSILENN